MLAATPVLLASTDHDHWWIVAPFFWALWIGVIVTAIWFFTRRRRRWYGSDRAKAILAERFAKGEISSDEFRERLEHLV